MNYERRDLTQTVTYHVLLPREFFAFLLSVTTWNHQDRLDSTKINTDQSARSTDGKTSFAAAMKIAAIRQIVITCWQQRDMTPNQYVTLDALHFMHQSAINIRARVTQWLSHFRGTISLIKLWSCLITRILLSLDYENLAHCM